MASPIRPEDFYAFGAETLQRVFEEQEQTAALGLNDLLPDVPQINNWGLWKNWERECRRGPVTVAGMLEAYRRGVQAGLEDAAQTANTIWKTDNDPKGIADVLGAMSRSSAYVSAVLKNKEAE
jgi:hypothetical protein